MLNKLFGKKGVNAPAPPEGERVYAIGDIHGRADLLGELLALIDEDIEGAARASQTSKNQSPGEARLIFLGDYVDRGPDSRGVIDRLIKVQQEHPRSVFLKGNHEAAMLDYMTSMGAKDDWLHWGGAETLESYEIINPWNREGPDLANALTQRLPRPHRTFLSKLTLTHTLGDYLFVHAGVKPGVALDEQKEEDLLWIRNEFHKTPSNKRPEKIIVHGHQPMDKPLDAGWRIAVDTGACWSGMLTAVVLEGKTRRFISTR